MLFWLKTISGFKIAKFVVKEQYTVAYWRNVSSCDPFMMKHFRKTRSHDVLQSANTMSYYDKYNIYKDDGGTVSVL